MRAGHAVLVLVAAALSFSASLPLRVEPDEARPASPAPGASAPPAPAPVRWETKYDTVRTDLSDYTWPTDAGRAITSTFGEFRRTHFHAGIDVSTGDRTGFKAFAARDGYVWRINVSPDGYGKVLYVRHRDGYTTVYAHLERFSKKIEARVLREQERLERYPVDITCEPGEFPVAKGDVIAYTGETGAGSPHLHFEIRDEHMNAVNPLLCPAYEISDDIKPGANAIALIPIGPGSRVDGANAASIRRLAPDKGGRMTARSPFTLSGDAGLAINIRDRSNETWYRHGVYRHTLRVDDSVAFEVRIDRVPVNEGQQIALYYAWPMLRSGRGRYEKLFVDACHELPFLSHPAIGAGVLSSFRLAPGPHTIAVRSEDLPGNTTEVVAEVTVEPPAKFDLPPWQGDGGTNGAAVVPLDVDLTLGGEFMHVVATAQGAYTSRPLLTMREGTLTRTLQMEVVSRSRAVATFSPDPSHQGSRTMTVHAHVAGASARGERTRSVYAIEPGRSGSFTLDAGALTVQFDAAATFGPLALTVDAVIQDGRTVYRFGPEGALLRGGLTVVAKPGGEGPKQALYASTNGRWNVLRTEALPDGTLRARMRRTVGDLAVLSDTTAPTIGHLRVQQRSGRRLLVSFGFDDALSGVDYESMKLYVDGHFCVPEIDGEHNRAVFLSAEPLSVGPHRVTISFSDELGNARSVERTVTVR